MQPDIHYQLTDGDDQVTHIRLYQEPDHHGLMVDSDFVAPDWARLEYHQCSHCPLSKDQYRDCPIARNLAWVLPDHQLGRSFDPIHLQVTTQERQFRIDTTAQRALSSLFGLVCALSDCPHTRFLRPMALFHLPVSTETETLARVAGFFLLQRHLAQRDTPHQSLNFDDLNQAYRNLGELNRCFVERFRSSNDSDAPINAMILLHVLTKEVNGELHEQLDDLAALFRQAAGDAF